MIMGDGRQDSSFSNYDEFFLHYLREHSKPLTRYLHIFGTLAGLCVLGVGIMTGYWWLALGALIVGYGFAWIGHFFVEHNRPATFKYPWWSFISDFRMIFLFFTGKLNDELKRAGVE